MGLSKTCLLTIIVATSVSSFHFGYQISYLNPLEDVITVEMNKALANVGVNVSNEWSQLAWGILYGSTFIGATIGCILFNIYAEKMSRLNGLKYSAAVIGVSCLLSALPNNGLFFWIFAICRLITGVGISMATAFQTTMIHEITDRAHLSTVLASTVIGVEIGTTFANLLGVDCVLGTAESWKWLMIIEALVSFVGLIYLHFYAYESPIYLSACGKRETAIESIRIYQNLDDRMAGYFLEDIESAAAMRQMSLIEILQTRNTRNALFLSSTVNLSVPFSGIIAVTFFGTNIIRAMKLGTTTSQFLNAAALSTGLLAAPFAVLTMKKLMRRTVINFGHISLLVLNALFMFFSLSNFSFLDWKLFETDCRSILKIGSIFVFCFVFNTTIGCINWSIGLSLATPESINGIESVSIMAAYVGPFVMSTVFPPLQSVVNEWAFTIFFVPLAANSIYCFLCMPETQNRTDSEIQVALGAKIKEVVTAPNEAYLVSSAYAALASPQLDHEGFFRDQKTFQDNSSPYYERDA